MTYFSLAMPSGRAGRVSPRAGSRLGHTATIAIAEQLVMAAAAVFIGFALAAQF